MNEQGYESREELIRDHWQRYGFHWDLKKMPRLSIAVRHKLEPYYPAEMPSGTAPLSDSLEFTIERGTLYGRPAYRVVCEGVVVEQRPL